MALPSTLSYFPFSHSRTQGTLFCLLHMQTCREPLWGEMSDVGRQSMDDWPTFPVNQWNYEPCAGRMVEFWVSFHVTRVRVSLLSSDPWDHGILSEPIGWFPLQQRAKLGSAMRSMQCTVTAGSILKPWVFLLFPSYLQGCYRTLNARAFFVFGDYCS